MSPTRSKKRAAPAKTTSTPATGPAKRPAPKPASKKAAAKTAGGLARAGTRKPAHPGKKSAPSRTAKKPSRPAAKASAAKAPVAAAPRNPIERRTALEVIEGGHADEIASVPSSVGAAGTNARGKYVYCVVRSGEPFRFGRIGLGAEPSEVSTVNYRDLAAVVSEVPMEVLDPTRENVLAHQQVTERVMRGFTVLPMSFGTVFKTDEDIVELLKSAYEAFGDVLQKMQDKFEFGFKVLWDPEQVIEQLEDEDEDLRRLKGEIASQKGSTYFARMQYGRMVDAALQERSERYVSEIFDMLRDVSVASRSNKPIGDKMIMNAAFLVSRDKEAAFDARVKRIGDQFPSLTFKYTGPWPAYNFVNIRLKLERAAP